VANKKGEKLPKLQTKTHVESDSLLSHLLRQNAVETIRRAAAPWVFPQALQYKTNFNNSTFRIHQVTHIQ